MKFNLEASISEIIEAANTFWEVEFVVNRDELSIREQGTYPVQS